MYLLPYLPPIFQNDAVTPSMKVSEAWTNGYTGNGVIIAIVDDGLQTDHQDLDDNVVKKHLIILYRLIYTHEKFEDTKGVTRSVIRRRTDNTMANTEKVKRTNYDLQNITQKIKE
jgi:subtilisin family serine protease